MNFTSRSKKMLSFFVFFLLASGYYTTSQAEPTWVKVFNGKNLDGLYTFGSTNRKDSINFKPLPDSNQLMINNNVTGYIATETQYTRYRTRLQYKANGNTGLLYHIIKDKVWPDGLEIQTMPGDAGSLWTTNAWVNITADAKDLTRYVSKDSGGVAATVGAATGRLHVVKNAKHEVSGWNSIEVFVWDDSLEIKVNSFVTMSCSKVRIAGTTGTQIPLVKGSLGLQAEGAITYFKNWEIMDLASGTTALKTAFKNRHRETPIKMVDLGIKSAVLIKDEKNYFTLDGHKTEFTPFQNHK